MADLLPKPSNALISALSSNGINIQGSKTTGLPNYTATSFNASSLFSSLQNATFAGDKAVELPKEYSEKDLQEARTFLAAKYGFSEDEVNSWTDEHLIEQANLFTKSSIYAGEDIPDFLSNFEDINDITTTKNSETEAEIQIDEATQEEEYETNINEVNRNLINDVLNSNSTKPWDPRIWRIDGYITASNKKTDNGTSTAKSFVAMVPFSTDTACSAFKDRKFVLPANAINQLENSSIGSGTVGDADTIGPQLEMKDGAYSENIITYYGSKTDKDKSNKDFYGLSSLMNPYSITLLAGGLAVNPTCVESENRVSFSGSAHPNLYVDIRDQRRFYDLSVVTEDAENNMKDVLSVSNPTTTNIIKFSSRDKWGRTPYAFQDFVYCKWWNVIPNNRLLTLRKYSTPCLDNLEFYGMYDDSGNPVTSDANATFSPISTVVTYFGDDTGNSLNSLLKFTTGPKWGELETNIHDVTGTAGTNSMEIIDQMVHGRNFGSGTGWIDKFFNNNLYFAGDKYVTLSKFLNLAMTPNGYDEKIAWKQKLTSAQMDPYQDGPLANKIQGPVNAIMKVMRREQGINFSQDALNVKCTYVAKEIGGINPKAAMLDILANCLMMGSVNAMFWGGGYRFKIDQNGYPWDKGIGKGARSFLEKMSRGEIFGENGAIMSTLTGIKSSMTDSTGDFNFNTITSKLGSVFSNLFAGLGDMIEGGINKLFGTSIDLFKGPKAEAGKATIKNVASNVKSNLTHLFKSELIKNTVYPNVTGMRALLTGEPVGNWHLTIGNPLNPIAVIGNLICEDVTIEFSEELGPDDFPVEMSAEFKLKHGMPRDSKGIQSMFNRGNGKIYDLPDYVSASSDQETSVDKFTGGTTFNVPSLISPTMYGAPEGRSYKLAEPTELKNAGNPNTSIITKFIPYYKDSTASSYAPDGNKLSSTEYTNIAMVANYPIYFAHGNARKALL